MVKEPTKEGEAMTDVKALEHSSLMVPYEYLNRTFRNAQKIIDREVSHLNVSTENLKKLSSKKELTVKETEVAFDEVINKLESLKYKATEAVDHERQRLGTCKRRLEHIKEYDNPKKGAQSHWKRVRLDRMLVDHFLRSGYYNTAVQMAETASKKDLVDIDLYLVARDVENALLNKDSAPCLQWCHTNKSKLKKLQSTLELNVRIQDFVELVRCGNRLEAVIYARKHFSMSGSEGGGVPEVLKTVMALLAFKPDTEVKRYKELFDETRWNLLVDQFRQENFALHQLSSQSALEIVLQCGLASLKTPHCYHEDERSRECPVCCRLFNELGRPLPFAHCGQSRLICSISGEPMNEHNHPLMLPNGNVYGELALSTMVDADGMVECPKTKERFKFDEALKVFIM